MKIHESEGKDNAKSWRKQKKIKKLHEKLKIRKRKKKKSNVNKKTIMKEWKGDERGKDKKINKK